MIALPFTYSTKYRGSSCPKPELVTFDGMPQKWEWQQDRALSSKCKSTYQDLAQCNPLPLPPSIPLPSLPPLTHALCMCVKAQCLFDRIVHSQNCQCREGKSPAHSFPHIYRKHPGRHTASPISTGNILEDITQLMRPQASFGSHQLFSLFCLCIIYHISAYVQNQATQSQSRWGSVHHSKAACSSFRALAVSSSE